MKGKDSRKAERIIAQYKRKLDIVRRSSGSFNPKESAAEQRARIDAALADPIRFAEEYLSHYCTSECADFHRRFARIVKNDPELRAVMRWARAHAKSVWADVILPLWLWARGEEMYLVIIGSSYDRAKVLLSDIQAEFEANSKLLHDFGDQQAEGSWEDGRFITKGGFVGQALGMGQSVRGLRHRALRPTYVVIDDCETKDLVKNEKRQWEMVRWIEMDVLGTMDGDVGRLIIANNGFAPSMIQRKLLVKHPTWRLDEVKAYDKVTYEPAWPQKYTKDHWRKKETEDGKLSVWAEYLHEPHVEGSIFTDDLIQYGKPPRIDHFKRIIGQWDVAYAGTTTADFNAVRVWGLDADGNFWCIGTFCKQSKMADAVRWMVHFDRELPQSVIVHWRFESQFWNAELERTIQEVCDAEKHELIIGKAELSKANKMDRIMSLHPYYQNNRVFFSEKLQGNADHEVGLAQLKGIEPGYTSHDDAPDADERAISDLSREHRVAKYQPPVFVPRARPKRSW